MTTRTILDEIVDWKRHEIARIRDMRPLRDVRAAMVRSPTARSLVTALRHPGVSLIAEIKRVSPSKGLLRPNLDPAALAQAYEANGARAISVLTDQRFFQGDLQDLTAVRQATSLPVLRKDFILDRYQVYEARAAGADAVLLIVAALSHEDLWSLYRLTRELDMDALIEVHNADELVRALRIDPRIIGINNRNLRTFQVDLGTTAQLRPLVPPDIVLVAESGVHSAADVHRLADVGVDAVLVGEAIVMAADVGPKVRELATGGIRRVTGAE